MRLRNGDTAAPRARRGVRRRGPAAIAAAVTATLALASLAVAASAPADSAAELASVEVPGAGSMLGVGPGGILGVGPGSGARDRGRPPREAAPAAAVRGSGADRHGSRGHGFVRDARGFATVDVPGATVPPCSEAATAASSSAPTSTPEGDSTDPCERGSGCAGSISPARRTFAAGIDDRGRVVGSYSDERDTPAVRSAEHGFLLDERGRFRTIDVRGATATRPAAISNRGQIAGEYVDRAGRSHGYLQDADGSVTTIDPPGAGTTVVSDVDDRGRVVGASVDAGQTAITAFMRDADGRFTTIVHPDAGFYGTQPQGIDNEGRIAGSYDADDRVHGFVLDDGAYTTIDTPDAPGNTQVLDIDDRGRLVGVSGLVSHGYLADGRGEPIDMCTPTPPARRTPSCAAATARSPRSTSTTRR
jgi:hypothetical protein